MNSANRRMPKWDGTGMARYALAIAHRRLGHDVEARHWLAKGDAWMASWDREAQRASMVPPDLYLVDYLEAKVLEREAKLK